MINIIPNKSNISKKYIIPFITSILLKYIYGDLDYNYQWSFTDIYYWGIIFITSYITLIINNNI